MQAGSLASTDVLALTSTVLVSGVVRAHESWSINREIVGDLPDQVVAGGGIRQATGTIVWAEQPDVTETAANPWNSSAGWLPKTGDKVVIYVSDGTTSWPQFRGVIDETTGDVGSPPQSSIIDDFDKLNAGFAHEPLMRVMPPLARGAADYRAVGLTHLFYADAALRVAGFYATPPREARTILSVPAQSSMWPEVGGMTAGLLGGMDGGPWAQTYDGPDGVALADFQNTYSPALSYPMTEPVRFSMTVSPDHSGNTTMKAYYGATDYVELAVAGSRTVVARLNGADVCTLAMGVAVRVSLLVKAGVWTLRTDNGATVTGSVANPTTAVLDRVVITADTSSRVAGFHAAHTSASTENLYTSFVPSAKYWMSSLLHLGLMDAGPTIEPTTCGDVLGRISKATLSAMWIDEAGIMQWAPSVNLRTQSSTQTVTTLDDITKLSWSDSLLGVRSRVEASYDLPGISRSRWDNILWHQGSTETLESGQVKTDFISPGSGTDWVGLGLGYLVLGDPGASVPSNNGWGSVTGAVLSDGTTEALGSTYLTSIIEKINVSTYKILHTVGSLPAGKKLELRYPSTSSTIWARWLKEAFPLIRGFGKTEWAKLTVLSSVPGPAYAPALTHDAGPWLSRENDTTVLMRVTDFIATQVTTPSPVITGMEVIYDPRRQLGDVITISSPKLLGIELTALIVGVRNSAGDMFTQSLDVRIITKKSAYTTYAEYDKTIADGLTYAQWQALGPLPQYYNNFNNAA